MFKKPESVLVVIHTLNLQILLIERARHPGYWQSVTGSLEEGESPFQAAQRELEEETGLIASADSLCEWNISNHFEILPLWRERYAPDVTHNLEHVFSFCIPDTVPVRLASAEHRDQCWLPWQEAATRCFSWTNHDAILMLPHRLAS
ncbi:dihydroneopterin triphosphate diphosphatase [Uliginosibacterium gangwonense]|uniref:dihydroneopterin triphosphate diphosphatase n=1 Tax=Uliginosibacterium gangwonense TaxID=392736 RepID=UPI0003654D77|nr:dihydroneopterin triphosphate diphosphatase [Uliginosibacterium gangwonense]